MQATANNIFHLSLTFFFFFMVLLSLGTSAAGVASDTLSNGRNLTDGNTLVGAARREESERLRPWPWPASPRRVASTRVLPREGADGIDRNGGRHGSRLRGEDGGLHGVTSRGAKLPVAGATVPRRREPLEAKGEKGGQLGIPIESANRRYRFSPMMFLMSLAVSESSPVQSKHLGWLDMMPVAVKLV
uniref:Uncharacterized protein n=1 Tax=Oryza meridionalis TaxID=40149 RepID=A0A0E0DIT0_9ORYZ